MDVDRHEPEQIVTQDGPGFSIRADRTQFAIKAPLGTTRIEWAGVDGSFVVGPDHSVRFRLKSEYLARRSAFFRGGIWLAGPLYGFKGMRIAAGDYGATAEELAAALNERLAEFVGQEAPSEARATTDMSGGKWGEGPFRRYQRLFGWSALGIVLLFLVVELVVERLL